MPSGGAVRAWAVLSVPLRSVCSHAVKQHQLELACLRSGVIVVPASPLGITGSHNVRYLEVACMQGLDANWIKFMVFALKGI